MYNRQQQYVYNKNNDITFANVIFSWLFKNLELLLMMMMMTESERNEKRNYILEAIFYQIISFDFIIYRVHKVFEDTLKMVRKTTTSKFIEKKLAT